MHRYFALFLLVLASVLGTAPAAAGGPGTATTTTVTSSNNPSTQGASVTLTATVTPNNATAATVDFFDGTTNIGTANPSAPGVYRLTLTNLASGTRSITARYNGAGAPGFLVSTSAALDQEVNATPSATAIAVVSSLNPSVYGDTVTFTATTSGGSAPLTVQFRDGGNSLGAPVAGTGATGNTFVFTATNLNAGTHSITARFAKGGNNVTSPAVSQVVSQSNDTVATLASSKNPANFAENVTFTASVSTGSGEVPTGSVTFKDGATTLSTATLAAGQATFATSTLTTGTHNIVVTYNGDTNYAPGANATVMQLVGAAGSATALTSTVNPSVVGQPFTLTAKVTTNSTSPFTGNVTFADGGTELGVVSLANGQATLAVPGLTVGSHSLTAVYGNDAAIKSSTGSLTQVVAKAQSTLTLSSSSTSAGVGAPVTFSAVVKVTAPGSATPAGKVTFKDGATTIGSVSVNATGLATFKTSTLSTGSHTITASYADDPRVNASQATLTQTISNTATTVSVETSPSASKYGEAVTINATLTSPTGTPTGAVTFKVGTTTLGTGALNPVGLATISTTELPVGTTTITAEYDGGVFLPGSGSVIHVVSKAETKVALASSPNPSVSGASVTFTATITPSGKATGTVEIFADDKSLGTFPVKDATGTFSTTVLTVGTHPIKITYSGDEQYEPASATMTHTVKEPGATGEEEESTSSSGGRGGEDEGCHVANVGSSTSQMIGFAALALGLILGLRRRRRRR